VEPEATSGDQSDLGVDRFDAGVGESVTNRGFGPGALGGDRAGELDERRQARSPRPVQPAVEESDRVLEPDVVDLAELPGEEVGAVERLVELLDPGEPLLLAVGEVGRVLPSARTGHL
jgi:hypothetical protein